MVKMLQWILEPSKPLTYSDDIETSENVIYYRKIFLALYSAKLKQKQSKDIRLEQNYVKF